MVRLLGYISGNNNLSLKYYSGTKDAPLSDRLIQASINTDNKLMTFYDSSWKDFPDTGRSTGEYIIFYQGGTIDYGTHVPGQVYQSVSERVYNTAHTSGMALAHFRMLIHESSNKDTYIVPDKYQLIILDRKYAVCMAKNGKDNNNKSHISRKKIL